VERKVLDVEGRLPLCFAMEKAKSVKSSYTPPTATKPNAADGDRGLEEVNCAKPVTRLRGKEKERSPGHTLVLGLFIVRSISRHGFRRV
jgi:hypothetical protein